MAKRTIGPGDVVSFRIGRGKKTYGWVEDRDPDTGLWNVKPEDSDRVLLLQEEKLTYVPRFHVTQETAARLLRYEITYEDFSRLCRPVGNWSMDGAYAFTLDDMTALIRNIREKKPDAKALRDWADLVYWDFDEFFIPDGDAEYDESSFLEVDAPANDAAMAEYVWGVVYAMTGIDPEEPIGETIDFDRVARDIDNYRSERPVRIYLWIREWQHRTLKLAEGDDYKQFSEDERQALRELVTDLARTGDVDAIRAQGYACYGGGLFPCDWMTSRDCFMRLIESDEVSDRDKCQYANTLGYIYYYGRCSGGVPDYESAFRYFSLGAAGGFYESMYKLSDMYLHGYGVPKNLHAAQILVDMVFSENLKRMERGDFGCKFADAALRMSGLAREEGDLLRRAYFAMLADFAIRKRIPYHHYGDESVFMNIQRELAQIRGELKPRKAASLAGDCALQTMSAMFEKNTCLVTVKPLKSGISITAERLARPGERKPRLRFECFPQYEYCNLVNRVTVHVKGLADVPEEKQEYIADEMETVPEETGFLCTFRHHAEEVFSVQGETVTRSLPRRSTGDAAEYRLASVEFRPGGRSYDYICELPDVREGDRVIVMGGDEEQEARVTALRTAATSDLPLPIERYRKLLRKA